MKQNIDNIQIVKTLNKSQKKELIELIYCAFEKKYKYFFLNGKSKKTN